MTSTLTKLLRENSAQRHKSIQNRDYETAQALREATFKQAADMKRELEEKRAKEHRIEARRLETARQLALEKVHNQVTEQLQHIETQWEQKNRLLEEKRKEREELFKVTETVRESHRPVVLSTYVRDLQRSEKRLADFHMYSDAAAVRRRIQKREVEEREEVIKGKEERVQKAVERKVKHHDEERKAFRRKMRNELALAKFRANNEEERIHNLYDHLQRDIQHCQTREQQINPLLAAYEKPRLRSAAASADAAKTLTHCHTGTLYFRKIQGSRFEVPSLCDLYAHTLGGTKSAQITPRLEAIPKPPPFHPKSCLTAEGMEIVD
jgi:hypothetical protein